MSKRISSAAAVMLALSMAAALGAQPAPSASSATEEQDKDTFAYKQAYSLVLSEKWAEALKAMEAVTADFPKSSWIEAARYWQCYSREKLGQSLEDVFKCYQTFVNAYPQSKWADDARANLVRAGHELAKAGKIQYEAALQSLEKTDQEDVRLAALYALQDSGDPEALKTILSLYDKTGDPRLKSRIIFMLQDSDSPEAFAKLSQIALNNPDVKARKSAIMAVADSDKPEAERLLLDVVKSGKDNELRRAALLALSDKSGPNVVPMLTDIALTDQDTEVAKTATHALSNVESKEVQPALLRIFKEAKDPEVRKIALFSLADKPNPQTLPLLREIILKEPDSELAKAAVFMISYAPGPESKTALKEIFASSKDAEIQRVALLALAEQGGNGRRGFPARYRAEKPRREALRDGGRRPPGPRGPGARRNLGRAVEEVAVGEGEACRAARPGRAKGAGRRSRTWPGCSEKSPNPGAAPDGRHGLGRDQERRGCPRSPRSGPRRGRQAGDGAPSWRSARSGTPKAMAVLIEIVEKDDSPPEEGITP